MTTPMAPNERDRRAAAPLAYPAEGGGLTSGVGRVTLLSEGGGTGGKKLRGNPQTGDADAPTTLVSPPLGEQAA